MLNIGGAELLIILLVALVFLGPQRLPEAARQLGQAVSSLRSLAAGFQAEVQAATKPNHAASMTLDGPTDQTEAIAATQQGLDGGALARPIEPVGTDPEVLKEAARNVDLLRGDDKPVSAGGPKTVPPIDSRTKAPDDVDSTVDENE
jgi:sec-independent protein translocase protein TatB